jgi:hypothetical protein
VGPDPQGDRVLLPDAGGRARHGPSDSRRLGLEEWRDRAADAGIAPETFWRQTPRETLVHLRVLDARERRAYGVALYNAWHVEAFARCERLPELGPLLDRLRDGVRDAQDADDQMNAARAIVAAFGTAEESA